MATRAQDQIYEIQGHRGCRGLMPENSIPAFLKALDLGVHTLEMDVVISGDGQVVVSHEPYFHADYCTKPDGTPVLKSDKINLYKLSYEQIKKYDIGARGNEAFAEQQKISTYKPLLSEVIEEVERYLMTKKLPPCKYNIEIKSEQTEYDVSQPKPAEFSELVNAVLVQQKIEPRRVVLQSFDFEVLKYWHAQITNKRFLPVKLSALVSNMKGVEANLKSLGFVPAIYSPYYRLLNQRAVEQLHQRGIKVIPWTVNTRDEMKQIKALGTDGLITDYPDRARGL